MSARLAVTKNAKIVLDALGTRASRIRIAEVKKTVVTRHANMMTAPASRFSQLVQLLVPCSFFL